MDKNVAAVREEEEEEEKYQTSFLNAFCNYSWNSLRCDKNTELD